MTGRRGVIGVNPERLAEALSEPLVEPLPRFGTTASAGATLERRIRCYAPGCGRWHTTRHTVDGLEVLSVFCAAHARDEQRTGWLLLPAELDPRAEVLRFLPSHVPLARHHLILVAAGRRPDLRPPPEPAAEWARSGDARSDYVPLAAPAGALGAVSGRSDPQEG